MTEIVVFGKPRAFESYSYIFGENSLTHAENIHSEPLLKPKKGQCSVLHYFARESGIGFEYYTRAESYESGRDGIVFGIALKASEDFNLLDVTEKILCPFWQDLAGALLDENDRFRSPSIIETLSAVQWSHEEFVLIQSATFKTSVKSADKGVLLLFAPNIEDIASVENIIKEYNDVYISDNVEIFKDPINDIVLKVAINQIYQIQGGKIEPLVTAPSPEKPQVTQPGIFIRIARLPIWGANAKSSEININRPTSRWDSIPKWGYSLFVFVGLVIILATCFWPKNADVNGNLTNGGGITEVSDTIGGKLVSEDDNIESANLISAEKVILADYASSIKNRLKLNPQIEPNNCSYVPSDITFNISDESLVHIDAEKYELVVDKRPITDTGITVKAYINGVLLGEQHYTIAKAEQSNLEANQDKHIPYFQGRIRTKDVYLDDLRRDLETSPEMVKKECQKIINGDYGDEYKMDSQAILLREEAKRIINQKAVEPSF